MKRHICIILALAVILGCTTGCKGSPKEIKETVTVDNSVETKKYDLKEIEYAASLYERKTDDT